MASRELSILVTAKNMASRALQDARRDVDGLSASSRNAGSTMRNAFSTGVGFIGAQVVGRAVSGLSGIVTGALDMNATLETSTLQFETLMGSADKAAEHVRGLFQFAATTPFETGPIIEASRLMHTFGGEALNTNENLTLFGNAAAATSTEINEVAFWSSRMYANLQAGRPFGEAAARLGELGIMTPQVRQQLEDMQKEGAKGPEVWGAYQESLERFDGAMEKQADSWAGLTSSLKDNFAILSATTFRPVFDTLKVGMKDALAFLSTPEAQQGAQQFAAQLAGFFNPDSMRSWASSAMEAFSAGVDFVSSVPWGTVGTAMQVMGSGAKVAMDAFLSAPPWLQTAVITGWGFNKLTGGIAGNLFGGLAGALGKWIAQKIGLMTVQASVVNVNGGVGGVPGTGGAAGKGGRGGKVGGVLGILGVAGVAAVAGSVDDAIAEAMNLQESDLSWPWGPKNTPTILPDLFGGNGLLGGSGAKESPTLQKTEKWSALTAANTRDAVPWLERNRNEIIELNQSEGTRFANLGAKSEAQKQAIHTLNMNEGQRASAMLARQEAQRQAINTFNASEGTRWGTGNAHLAAVRALEATNSGKLSGILAKKSAVTVNTTVLTTVNVSAAQINQQVQSLRESTNSGGFI